MTPRIQCLPRPALPRRAPLAGLLNVSATPAGGGIARVPRLAVVRPTPPPAAGSTPAPAGSRTILRDILSGLVDELAGAAAGAKGADPAPVANAEENPPTDLPPRRAPWRRPFFPRTGVACFPLHQPLPVT